MCLAIPGRVVRWHQREPLFAEASVEFAGIQRRVNMACVPETQEGEFVLVHAGVAIARIDEVEAQRTLATLQELDLLRETGG